MYNTNKKIWRGKILFAFGYLCQLVSLPGWGLIVFSTSAPRRISAVDAVQTAGLHTVNASKTCGLEGRPYCWVFFLSFTQLSMLYFVHSVLVVISASR